MSQTQENISNKNTFVKQVAINLAWLSVVFGLVFGTYKAISQENVLPIKEISISGEFNHLSAQELHSLVVNGFQGNFFTLSVNEIYQKFYALPWVEQIWVHRVWPDKINIEIRENNAVAILKNKGLLNDKGKVFLADAATFENTLPLFDVASDYEEEAIASYYQYEQMLGQIDLGIRRFEFDRRKSQTLQLSNGLSVTLGRLETEKRLKRFISAYNGNLVAKASKIEGVDLRYTNGFAVKWKQAKSTKSLKVSSRKRNQNQSQSQSQNKKNNKRQLNG